MPTSASSPTAGESNGNPEGSPAPETNFPATAPSAEPVEEAPAVQHKEGEVWATWTGQQPGERILTVRDLKELGDKEATEPLKWDHKNRWALEISGVHPMVERYIEFHDGSFTVERF